MLFNDVTWEKQWVLALKDELDEQHEKAWDDFTACYYRLLRLHVRYRLGNYRNRQEVELDLTQIAFMRSYKYRKSCKKQDVEGFYLWLRVIASHEVANFFRQQKGQEAISWELFVESGWEEIFIDITQKSLDDLFEIEEFWECFGKVYSQLNDDHKRWILKILQGMKPKEIAEEEGLKEGAVRRAWERFLGNLRGRCKGGDTDA